MNTPYQVTRLDPADIAADFRCGKHPLDDFFARHALPNDRAGICRVYVLRRRAVDAPNLPAVLGFYTLSMASVTPQTIPVILESIVSAEFIDDEIEAAHEALAIGGPRPRVRKRRSGATAKPVHA